MLRAILHGAVRRLDEILRPPDPSEEAGDWSIAPAQTPPPPPSPLDTVTRDILGSAAYVPEAEVDRLGRLLLEREGEIGRLRRQLADYWTIIERFERQRDQWRDLYKDKTKGYQTLVSKLRDLLAQDRQLLVRALHTINQYRREKELPPLDRRITDQALAKCDPSLPELQSARTFYEDLKRTYEHADPLLRRADLDPPVLDESALSSGSHEGS
jgi:hypothetical protein